jgi:ATP synthase protein I
MTERNKPDSLQDLDDRLHRLRAQEEGKKSKAAGALDSRSGLGLAGRIGVEVVAAVGVGAGLGFLLDRWLGTAPWLMVVLFLLGAAAGMMNVYRVMKGMSQAVGYSTEKTREDDQPRGD